jgi:hypothetical protein
MRAIGMRDKSINTASHVIGQLFHLVSLLNSNSLEIATPG